MIKHTPGPWRWELNEAHKDLSLVGGRPEFDLTIIQPIRWGMGSATLFVRDTAHDGMNLLHKLHERRDWITPFPGRNHHAKWCAGVSHPDMRLIESAPDLLADLIDAAKTLRRYETLHRAKGTTDSDAKAEANASLAARFEATIFRATGDEA